MSENNENALKASGQRVRTLGPTFPPFPKRRYISKSLQQIRSCSPPTPLLPFNELERSLHDWICCNRICHRLLLHRFKGGGERTLFPAKSSLSGSRPLRKVSHSWSLFQFDGGEFLKAHSKRIIERATNGWSHFLEFLKELLGLPQNLWVKPSSIAA